MEIFFVYLLGINLAAFLMYGLDKWKAKKDRWRIPEKVLIGIAVFGGGIGALIGMRVFHHKTKKMKFFIGVPLILILQIAIVVFCFLH